MMVGVVLFGGEIGMGKRRQKTIETAADERELL
jgi:hypothetical protein